ncbi:hypothetical protein PTTG_03157 [Puccinia triticina 1-1 BBBD Race 1]|uniref:Uncharacterized protein n=1 Tax=Puccinia triticina (isolate 1-1 / race 1 (BBBD)) TaxID=630390 RepID=A0A180GYW8_PUCT1|nr:hypothetical protein PTTG_03157 [Puccinia triticina 1-1 BBBD Race 1]
MSQPLTGDHSWDQFEGSYNPLGTDPGNPINPAGFEGIAPNMYNFSWQNFPGGPHGQNPGGPHGQNPAGPGGGSTASAPNGQTPGGLIGSPASSPLGQNTGGPLGNDLASPTTPMRDSALPGGRPWSPSSTNPGGRSPPTQEDLQQMQRALASIDATFALSDDLIRRAQPLFQMTPEARNMAILLLALHNGAHPTLPPMIGEERSEFSQGFKTYLCNAARRVLLDPNIHSYGSRATRWLRVSETPVSKVMSNKKKTALAVLIKVKLSGSGTPAVVPNLYKLISNVYGGFHPDFKRLGNEKIHSVLNTGAKFCLCYLQFMANFNRINHCRQSTSRQILFWDDIDKDLARLRRKLTTYGVAYAQLIYRLDKAVWDGKKTVKDAEQEEDKQQPHSEEEIQARVAVINQDRGNQEVDLELP